MRSIVFALACAILCIAHPAVASEAQRPPPDPSYEYVSTDVGYFSAVGGGTATTLNVGVGYRLDRHYAIEGGYFGVFDQGVSANGGYVDAYGYLPLGRHSRVSLFSTVGVSYISSVYIGGTGYYASAFGFQAGGGIEWRFSEKWAVRAAVRYQTTIVDAAIANIGFTVRF